MFNEKWYKKAFKLLILPVGVYMTFFILSRALGRPAPFGVGTSLQTILIQTCGTVALAWGASFNLRSFRFDFSLGALQILAVILGTNFAQVVYHAAPVGSPISSISLVAFTSIFGLFLGMLVGGIYIITKVAPIVIGLAMALIYEGVSGWLVGGILPHVGAHAYGSGASIANDVHTLGMLGRIPWLFVITGLLGVAFFLYNKYSVFGYHVKAFGMNQQRISVKLGVNEKLNVLTCYAVGGLGAGFAGAIRIMTETNRVPQFDLMTIGTLTGALGPVFVGVFLAKHLEITTTTLLAAFTYACLGVGLANLLLPAYLQNIVMIAFLMVFLGLAMNAERRRIGKIFNKRGLAAKKKLENMQAAAQEVPETSA